MQGVVEGLVVTGIIFTAQTAGLIISISNDIVHPNHIYHTKVQYTKCDPFITCNIRIIVMFLPANHLLIMIDEETVFSLLCSFAYEVSS